ncbi:MAG TPA: hypothetical protein VJ436_09750 [Anaerolineales bacterium]|nr:hypothetical protein [Anaerolineales bacterium]
MLEEINQLGFRRIHGDQVQASQGFQVSDDVFRLTHLGIGAP